LRAASFLNSSDLRSYSLTNRSNNKVLRSTKLYIIKFSEAWNVLSGLSLTSNCNVSFDDEYNISSLVSLERNNFVKCSSVSVRGIIHPLNTCESKKHSSTHYVSYNHKTPSTKMTPINFQLLHKASRPAPSCFLEVTKFTKREFNVYKSFSKSGKRLRVVKKNLRTNSLSSESSGSSVQSDRPFPFAGYESQRVSISMFDLLRHAIGFDHAKIESIEDGLSKRETVRPFCCPYVYEQNYTEHEAHLKIDVTPRLVAYFELSITCNYSTRSCNLMSDVAVGLSTKGFLDNELLPGEDPKSFGFHGKDGHFYYNDRKYSNISNCFGYGDTIGCGIDYVQQSIFFTLNGKFLTHAFKHINMETQFFPTIGVRGSNIFEYNFGERPFVFDLKKFCSNYSSIVKGAFLKQKL